LVLRYYADMDDASIADLLGVSVSGVRATAARALQVLRDGRAQDAVEEAR
jgi:DNA-directed RNA polymerase specialized sigma24 family protein